MLFDLLDIRSMLRISYQPVFKCIKSHNSLTTQGLQTFEQDLQIPLE